MPLPLLIALVLLCIAYAMLMAWYWAGWWRTKLFVGSTKTPVTKVSIIIAARNEAANIGACLDSISKHDYPTPLFEIIVVDDHSNDETAEIAKRYPQVKLLVQDSGIEGKKKAIEKGIAEATGTMIVTTDADCTVGANWLSTIVDYYETYHPVMIAGPVYFKNTGSLLGIWQLLDFAGLMAITAASIKNGLPQMCNGANLAYQKSAFEKVGGFKGIDGVPTGDDALLMMKMHKVYPDGIHFLKSPAAISVTSPQPDLSSLVSQRVRWVSKSKVFPDWRVTAILVIAYFFNLAIVVIFASSFWFAGAWMFALALFLVKLLMEFPLLYGSLGLPNQRRYLMHLIWVQVLHMLYVVAIGPLSLVAKYQWKGRSY